MTLSFKKKSKETFAFYLIYLRYMKDGFTTKFKLISIKSHLNINMDLGKDLMFNNVQ